MSYKIIKSKKTNFKYFRTSDGYLFTRFDAMLNWYLINK